MTRISRLLPIVTPVAAVLGCSTPVEPDAGLQIVAARSWLAQGDALSLKLEAGGRAVSASDVEWSSHDISTAMVEDGLVSGIAPGVTLIVASRGDDRDSLLVNVRFNGLGIDDVALRIQGLDGDSLRAEGGALFSERLGVTEDDRFRIWTIVDEEADLAEREIWKLNVEVPGLAGEGVTVLPPATHNPGGPLRLSAFTSPASLVIKQPSGQRGLQYAFLPVSDVVLEVDTLALPNFPGLRLGEVTGRVWFEAAGLVLDREDNIVGQVSDTTVNVYAEVRASLRHSLVGQASIAIEGGPTGALARENAYPRGEAFHSQIINQTAGVRLRLGYLYPDPPVPYVATLEAVAWLGSPAAGTFAIDSTGPELRTSIVDRDARWARIEPRVDPLATDRFEYFPLGGTVTVTLYDPASAQHYGRVLGTVDATLAVWLNGEPTGETVAMTASFFSPIDPFGLAR